MKREMHGHRKGHKRTPEYNTWLGIKRRCYDSNFKDYPNWGGKGIRVEDVWRYSFPNFLRDMGEKPDPKWTIDRINHKANYAPGNCRWVPHETQGAENKDGLRAVTILGVAYVSLAAACRVYGVGRTTLNERLKRGIPMEEAVTTPTRGLRNTRSKESYLPKNHPKRK